ncbi:MAG: CocE/NonD family hydrolase [Bacteroidota bacterium]
MNLKKFCIVFCTLLSAVILTSGGDKQKSPPTASENDPVCYAYRAEGKDREIKITSFYLTMRDGVRIAVSVYLPSNLKAGDKLPTILHQTRYWRSINLRWPLSAFKSKFVDGYSRMIKKIALNGYAVVNVDVRGTGASFGNEKIPFSKDQIKDGEEILNWIVQQKWSDGGVGLLGASYTGMAAEFLLANKHPSIKAVMSLYTGLDFYDEMLFPGGVYHQSFVKKYGEVGAMLDENNFSMGSKLENFFIKGVTPVQKNGRRLLKQAVAGHTTNFNIYDQTRPLNFRDDAPEESKVKSIDELSLHSRLADINAANVPICLFSGWFDGSFALGSARLFNNLEGKQNKLIIGPWDHGSVYNCSPFVQQKCAFDRVAEVLKFFDYHLKKKDNGLDKEAPVRYFTMGEDQWKTSKTWPPAGTVEKAFYFSGNNQLSAEAQTQQTGYDTYIADTSAATGNNTRSESLVFMLTSPKMYDTRTERDKKLLCYNSLKLENDIEVTGHPIITLYIDADTSDAGFFVYLEDIDEAGEAHYITEGIFRAIHRNSQGNVGYKDIVPSYTYSKDAKAPLKRNEVAKIEFDLLPVSHAFKKGHSIRIAISCADRDHYKQITPAGSKINVHRNAIYASKIMLPVMPETKSTPKP